MPFHNRALIKRVWAIEPDSGTGWSTIKGYAEDIIPIIRSNDPDAVIVVGTPTWSQNVDTAASDPITGYKT